MELSVEKFFEIVTEKKENPYQKVKGKEENKNYNPEAKVSDRCKQIYRNVLKRKGEFTITDITKGLEFESKSVKEGEWDRAKRLLYQNGYILKSKRIQKGKKYWLEEEECN